MRLLVFLVSQFFFFRADAQSINDIHSIEASLSLKKNAVYLFCRGTTQKAGLMVRRFNIADSNISHVGIGFLSDAVLRIYNVTDDRSGSSALHVDSLESFVSCGSVFYFSAWDCNVTPDEYKNIKIECEDIMKRKIYFDGSFLISTDDSLYCSEFCSLVLNRSNPVKFNFKPKRLMLENKLYEAFLNRKIFYYFPVDFFETSPFLTRIFEYHL